MNKRTTSQSLFENIVKRAITPLFLLLIGVIGFVIVVYDRLILIAGSILIAALILLIYSKLRAFRSLVTQAAEKDRVLITLLCIVFAIAIPLALRTQPYIIHIFIIAEISIILALGLNFQVGSTGIPNLGYAAFYGVGAYTSALLSTRWGVSFWLSMLAAGVIAAIFGWLVGLPTLKTRSYHMALVSIAFGLVTYIMLNNLAFTGGPNGIKNIPAPELFGWSLFSTVRLFNQPYPVQLNFYYLALLFVLIMGVVSYFIYQSKIGLFWNAVREDEIAAKCSGINTAAMKLLSFTMGAFFAGIAGSLYAHYVGYISPENFNMNTSLQILGMVIMGGMDNIFGVGIGAFILSVAPEKLRSLADFRMLATGLIIILMLMFRPDGILKQRIRSYSTKWLRTAKTEGGDNNG